jgi:hypothetical protein
MNGNRDDVQCLKGGMENPIAEDHKKEHSKAQVYSNERVNPWQAFAVKIDFILLEFI